MDRRCFLKVSGLSLAGLAINRPAFGAPCSSRRDNDKYSIVILGDTHYDAGPSEVYHSLYNEPVAWLNDIQRKEFARNGEMWRERCPRLVERAAALVDGSTEMVFQMGDLIQGDCGNGEVHRKMLDDVMNLFKGQFGGLPFITVAGNHDIRGLDARKVYNQYMPQRLSEELGIRVPGTTFSFNIGDDAYIVLDFSHPDDDLLEKLIYQAKGARHTFLMVHAPLFPYDSSHCRWIFHGQDNPVDNEARRHFRRLFAEQNTIVLCGHTHKIEFLDWYGDGGRITQMTMNSVWSNPELAAYKVVSQGPEKYGESRKSIKTTDSGKAIVDETALFDEYRSGLRSYSRASGAGSYKMMVSDKRLFVDYYAGDSQNVSKRFILR